MTGSEIREALHEVGAATNAPPVDRVAFQRAVRRERGRRAAGRAGVLAAGVAAAAVLVAGWQVLPGGAPPGYRRVDRGRWYFAPRRCPVRMRRPCRGSRTASASARTNPVAARTSLSLIGPASASWATRSASSSRRQDHTAGSRRPPDSPAGDAQGPASG